MDTFLAFIVFFSLAVGIITFVLGIKKLSKAGRNRTTFFFATGIALFALLATFATTFSILDVFVYDIRVLFDQEGGLFSNFKDLNMKKIMLKVSILVVSLKLFTSLLKLYKDSDILGALREDFGGQHVFSRKTFKSLSVADWDEKLAGTNGSKGRELFMELRNFSQLAFYLSVALFILIQYLDQETAAINGYEKDKSIFFVVANGALFFILDDWNIMNDYSRVVKGNILANHRTKIRVTNLVLLIACPLLLLTLLYPDGPASAADMISVLIFGLALACAYYWRTYLDFNKYVKEPKKAK